MSNSLKPATPLFLIKALSHFFQLCFSPFNIFFSGLTLSLLPFIFFLHMLLVAAEKNSPAQQLLSHRFVLWVGITTTIYYLTADIKINFTFNMAFIILTFSLVFHSFSLSLCVSSNNRCVVFLFLFLFRFFGPPHAYFMGYPLKVCQLGCGMLCMHFSHVPRIIYVSSRMASLCSMTNLAACPKLKIYFRGKSK